MVVGVGDWLGLAVGSARTSGEYRSQAVSTVSETRRSNERRTEASTTERMLLPIPDKKEGPAGPSHKQTEIPALSATSVLIADRNADVLKGVHLLEHLVDAVEVAGSGHHRLGRNLLGFDHLQHRGVVRCLHA